MANEPKKRLTDKNWRINNLYWITDLNANRIKFKPNKAQKHFDNHKALRNIVLKSRRLGFTTYECIDMLDDALFNPGFEGLMIAHKKEEADKIFDKKIQYAWRNIRQEVKDVLWKAETDRTNALKFNFIGNENSSISVATSGRSGTNHRVHISELAKLCATYPQTANEVFTGTIPSVPSTGRVDIESTAEGEEGLFHDLFIEAWERGEPRYPTEYKAHFYNWQWEEAELQQITSGQIEQFINSLDFTKHFAELHGSFKDYQERNELTDKEITYWFTKWLSLGRKFNKLFSEYPTSVDEAFAVSGAKLFDKFAIEKQKQFEQEGERIGDWVYFENYKPGHIYAGGADVGHGVGKDSSTIVIMDFFYPKPKVVAEYASNDIDAAIFAHEVMSGGTRYGNCLMAVENNDRGYTTNIELARIYNQVYIRKIEGQTEEKETKELGWRTTGATKPKMLIAIKNAYNDELIAVPSKRLNREARTYDENDLNVVKYDEESTKHWDLLTALAICWQMRTEVQYGQSGDGGLNLNQKKPTYQ